MLQLKGNMTEITALGGFTVYERILHMGFRNFWGEGGLAKLNKIFLFTVLDYFISR